MPDLRELRALLAHREALELELAELEPQLRPLERENLRLQIEVNNKQLDADSLSKPGLRTLFLGWTGKKEAARTTALRELRNAREQLHSTTFRLETLRSRVEAIRQELRTTSEAEADCLRLWKEQTGREHEEADQLMRRVMEDTALSERFFRELKTLKDRLSVLDSYYATGDIQTDLTGRRYDNKFHTMKKHASPCQDALTSFLKSFDAYTSRYKPDLQFPVPDSRIMQADYLTAPSFDARELYEQAERVSAWISQLEHRLKVQKAAVEAEQLACLRALRACLMTLCDTELCVRG